MGWLAAHMWLLFILALLLGWWLSSNFAASRRAAGRLDHSAELAAARTRHQECEAERVRVKARAAEIDAKLTAAQARITELESEVRGFGARQGGAQRFAAAIGGVAAPHEDDAAYLRRQVRELQMASSARAADAGVHAPFDDDAAVLRRQVRELQMQLDTGSSSSSATPTGSPPTFLSSPEFGEPDDLKKIKGVGPKLEGLLHSLGVYYYAQIASWTSTNVAEVDDKLQFPGRIERDDWIAQAKQLAGGRETEFSKRYASGDN